MTREEAINFGKMFLEVNEDSKNSSTYEFIDMALKLFKQEPCEDCISRAQAINELQKICDDCDSDYCGCCRIDTDGTYLDSAKKMLKRLPSVKPKQKTDDINKSNFSQEQYKADLQCAYDCGRASVKPCEDAISRADAIKVASGYCHPQNIAEELAKLPHVTPKQKVGHWINKSLSSGCGIRFVASECTCCGRITFFDCDQLIYNYCPHCGAKMVEPQESEEKDADSN